MSDLWEKYGRDRVAHLGTVAMYRIASAMKETAAALDVPAWKVEKVSSGLASDAGDMHFNAGDIARIRHLSGIC